MNKKNTVQKNTFLLPVIMILGLQGCGGSSENATILKGQFKDSNTEGLTYVSGGTTGTTDVNGGFLYEEGQEVTFSVGGVTIGKTSGKAIITPLDLVADASSASTKIKNIVRFLMLLDVDADPSNGIKITVSPETTKSWAAVNFNAPNLQDELSSIIADVGTSLPTAEAAKAHLEATLRCTYAGAYEGKFIGSDTDNGSFGFLVNALDGNIEGAAYNVPKNEFITISGLTPLSYNSTAAFISGDSDTSERFSGGFTSTDAVSGTWNINATTGTFSGARIGGATDAIYRFTANYKGVDQGLFTFDVTEDDSVVGIVYSARGTSGLDSLTLSGSVVGDALSVTSSDGKTKITGTLNKETGALSGEWDNDTDNLAGTFTGSGCKLN